MFDYRLEHIFSYNATLEQPAQVIGAVPDGIRINFLVTGGEVLGPKVKGRFVPGGGDWLTLRTDGVAILDVRATIETDDGALIYVVYGGVADLGPDAYQGFVDGQLPTVLSLRVVPRFHTAHADYLWLNRIQGLSIGEADLARSFVQYDTYAVR